MSRYLVVGAGAVGTLLAGQWTRARQPVTLVGRGLAAHSIADTGITLVLPERRLTVRPDVAASIADARPRASDTVVLATRATDVEATLDQIAWVPLADRSGVVADLPIVTLQSGLGAEDAALRRFERVIGASVAVPVRRPSRGVVEAPGTPIVGVAALGGYRRPLPSEEERHRAGFALAGFAAWIEPDIAAAKRRRLLQQLANVADVFALAPGERDRVAEALVAEARRVFTAARLPVAPAPWEAPSLEVAPLPGGPHDPRSWSPIWRGLQERTSAEIPSICGEVAFLARSQDLDAPLNAAVLRAVATRHPRPLPGELPLPPEFLSGSLLSPSRPR